MSDTPDSEGPAQAGGPFAAGAEEVRTMESRPRRVILRRDDTGSYCIFMGSRMVQGFCNEFEDITGFAMGANTQQQVRIFIDPIGRRQRAHYPERDEPEESLPELSINRDQGVELFSSAHPGNPTITMTWQDEARQHLAQEIEQRQALINMLAGM